MKKTEQQERNEAVRDVQIAHEVKLLLENKHLNDALDSIEIAMFEQFKDTKLNESDVRHELWQRMQLMKQFRGKLENTIRQGVKAEQTLSMLDRAKKVIGL